MTLLFLADMPSVGFKVFEVQSDPDDAASLARRSSEGAKAAGRFG